jgi:hypothetical protein
VNELWINRKWVGGSNALCQINETLSLIEPTHMSSHETLHDLHTPQKNLTEKKNVLSYHTRTQILLHDVGCTVGRFHCICSLTLNPETQVLQLFLHSNLPCCGTSKRIATAFVSKEWAVLVQEDTTHGITTAHHTSHRFFNGHNAHLGFSWICSVCTTPRVVRH